MSKRKFKLKVSVNKEKEDFVPVAKTDSGTDSISWGRLV